ncbi:protein MioC [Aeromonas diversa CDC 2478-85]|uniref:Protein MioC n=2 Tax=Aeromonas TaxID=642 RepID=N9U405_9GAMM|nr:flavodoxin [Aeromonas diversa]ENY73094.1 protein MioC [Aeromonas diversa CDC 2478-85]
MARIDLFVGTVYGSAALVAERLSAELEGRGHRVTINEEARAKHLSPERFLLLVTSTTGQGDIPDNLAPFADDLRNKAPWLSPLQYALIAMGDSAYGDTFCGAGRTLDGLLQELGARPLVPHLEIDASEEDEPERPALTWLKGWAARLDTL